MCLAVLSLRSADENFLKKLESKAFSKMAAWKLVFSLEVPSPLGPPLAASPLVFACLKHFLACFVYPQRPLDLLLKMFQAYERLRSRILARSPRYFCPYLLISDLPLISVSIEITDLDLALIPRDFIMINYWIRAKIKAYLYAFNLKKVNKFFESVFLNFFINIFFLWFF